MKGEATRVCVLVLLLTAAVADAQDYGGYAGKGGMGARKIEPHVYEYHYDHGFTGEDAMGWEPDLQFAWSRLAAAEACGVTDAPSAIAIDHLIERYGQSASVHETVGIGFHAAQIQANPAFCSAKRKEDLSRLMPEFERGEFSATSAAGRSPSPGPAVADMMTPAQPVAKDMPPTAAVTPSAAQAPLVAAPVSTAVRIPLSYRTGAGENGRDLGDEVLRVVRRAHTGRAVGLQVLTGALLGGVNGVGFGKARLHGEKIKAIPNPGQDLLQAALRSRLDAYFSMHPDALPTESLPVQISGHDWLLIYQELGNGSTPYELRYSADIQGLSKRTGFLRTERSPIALHCQPAPRTASLERWEAEDYAAVKAVAEEYAAQCASEFENQLAIWFPVPPPARHDGSQSREGASSADGTKRKETP